MAIINGTNFELFENENKLGHSTSCTLATTLDLPDVTSKDSQGWSEFIAGVRGASLSADGLVDYEDILNFEQLCDRIITRAKMRYSFQYLSGSFVGEGYIASAEETADMEAGTGYSVTITIVGGLSFVASGRKRWEQLNTKWEELDTKWEDL